MGPLTGGCHYDGGCGRFHNVCGACPVLGSAGEDDLSRQSWRRRHAALAHVPERPHDARRHQPVDRRPEPRQQPAVAVPRPRRSRTGWTPTRSPRGTSGSPATRWACRRTPGWSCSWPRRPTSSGRGSPTWSRPWPGWRACRTCSCSRSASGPRRCPCRGAAPGAGQLRPHAVGRLLGRRRVRHPQPAGVVRPDRDRGDGLRHAGRRVRRRRHPRHGPPRRDRPSWPRSATPPPWPPPSSGCCPTPTAAPMGQRCRQVAVDEYGLVVQATRYRDLYQALIPA